MLILLIPATFISVFLSLTGYHVNRRTSLADWRMSFLQSATFLGGYMVLFSELLSLFHALTTFWVASFWSAALILSIVLGWKKGWIVTGVLSLKNAWKKPDGFDLLVGSMVILIMTLLFFIAVKSPVNNNDSLRYHLARVAHWIQNNDLSHFATSYLPQVMHPIGAELAILNAYLLRGNDGLVNLIQWASMAGVLVAVSGVVLLLGGSRSAQWMAIAFSISLPVAILESTSTQNDLVVAFWYQSLLFFIFLLRIQESPSRLLSIIIGLCLGMGMLSKATFYPYAVAPLLYMMIFLFRQFKFRQVITSLFLVGIFSILINLGYWARNMVSFGSPFGQQEFVSSHLSHEFNPGVLITGVLRNISQNLVTPSDSVNAAIVSTLKIGLSPLDPAMQNFNLEWGWNHEDLAGNPLHLGLIFLSLILLLISRRKFYTRGIWPYLGILLISYVMLGIVVRYDLYGNRYQLPIFIAFAPLLGITYEVLIPRRIVLAFSIILLLTVLPWVLFNRTRPLIAMRDSSDPYTIPCYAGCTAGSILIEPPEKTMFAVWGSLGNAYVEAMNQVKATGCQNIGLKLDSNDLEYAYWYFLGAPQNGMRLESIVTYPELERYMDPNFKPCVIICTTCGKDMVTLNGLDLIGEFKPIKVYSDK
jgi:hypothetical protein